MKTRRFISDTDLDNLLDALTAEGLPVATLDQLDAASKEAAQINLALALHAVADGGHAFLATPGHDTARLRRMIRPRLRMLLAAFSAGAVRLCPHTEQIRPQLLVCDPPSLNCMQAACMATAASERQRLGIQWNHQCDACGQHVEILTPHLLALGPLSISGHLCATCTATPPRPPSTPSTTSSHSAAKHPARAGRAVASSAATATSGPPPEPGGDTHASSQDRAGALSRLPRAAIRAHPRHRHPGPPPRAAGALPRPCL